ncbi:hypothetical protein WJX79_007337 [Trebouxia sp. C0005]
MIGTMSRRVNSTLRSNSSYHNNDISCIWQPIWHARLCQTTSDTDNISPDELAIGSSSRAWLLISSFE